MPELEVRDKFEQQFVTELRPIFEAQYIRALRSPDAFDYGQFEANMRSVFRRELSAVFALAGELVLETQKHLIRHVAFDTAAEQWASGFSPSLAARVVESSQGMVQRAIENAKGDKKKLRASLALIFMADSRLFQIATTEVTRATTAGEAFAIMLYHRDPLRPRLTPIWRTSRRRNVCRHCKPLEGKSEIVWKLKYPNGPPGHPNCILPGNNVLIPGECNAGTKAFYVGRCIEARLANGRIFSVTVNHPVLTTRGWMPAKLLNESVDVLCAVNANRIASIVVPHDNHMPTRVEQVFESLEKSPSSATARVPAAAKDFHGDAIWFDGDVDIVNKLGHLMSNNHPTINEQLRKEYFQCGLVSGAHSGCSSLNQFVVGCDLSAPSPVGSTYLSRALRFAHGAPQFTGGLRESPAFNAGSYKASLENVSAESALARKFQDRFTGLISPSKVVEIRNFNYSGHVFDLQSEPYRLYFCNDAIVHNCACWLDWVPVAVWASRKNPVTFAPKDFLAPA